MKSAHFLKNCLPPNFLFWLVAMSFFFLGRWRKEREKKESGCWALNTQKSSHHEMLVYVMGLSRNISFSDKALLSGRISKILASTWSVLLVSNQIYSVLLLALGVFLSWWRAEVGLEIVPGEGSDYSDSIAVFHVWQSLLQTEAEGSVGIFLRIVTDESLPLPSSEFILEANGWWWYLKVHLKGGE